MQPATEAAPGRLHAALHICARTLFARGALKDVLFVGAAGDEAVHLDLLVLPNAVAARHRLQVVLWGQERNSRRTQKEKRRKMTVMSLCVSQPAPLSCKNWVPSYLAGWAGAFGSSGEQRKTRVRVRQLQQAHSKKHLYFE